MAPFDGPANAEDVARANALESHKGVLQATKAAADAEIATKKADLDANLAQEATANTVELGLRKAYHEKVMEVAAGGIERARDSAKFVQTAGAALIVADASLLALVFSNEGKPLPLRGTYASLFLALAIAFAVAYMAFLKHGAATAAYKPGLSDAETDLYRTSAFVDWVNGTIANRRTSLRAAVLAFGFGVAFIPAPFIGATGGSAPTAAVPNPPAIPLAVPLPVREDATKLFKAQVDAYLSAVAPSGAKATPKACPGPFSAFRGCGWSTEAAVEKTMRWLAGFALVVIVVVPLVLRGVDKTREPVRKSTGSGLDRLDSGGPEAPA